MAGIIETAMLLKECGRGEDELMEAAKAKLKEMTEEEDRTEDDRIFQYWEPRMSSAAQVSLIYSTRKGSLYLRAICVRLRSG